MSGLTVALAAEPPSAGSADIDPLKWKPYLVGTSCLAPIDLLEQFGPPVVIILSITEHDSCENHENRFRIHAAQ